MSKPDIRIDIVSDVVCPWCIIGYKQLEKALDGFNDKARFSIHWQPFELNPHMPAEGENLREHLAAKYGTTPEGSKAARARLTNLGASLGFPFNYFDAMRMVNTFKAHQLLHWAGEHDKQTEMKMALFEAYFSLGKNVNDESVLAEAAARAGLDRDEAAAVLADGRYADAVRNQQKQWLSRGIQAVPAVILDGKYLINGAQESGVFENAISKVLQEKTA
jgi:predicted DsbA family dithiol-disulfide isomerase